MCVREFVCERVAECARERERERESEGGREGLTRCHSSLRGRGSVVWL